LQLKQVNKGATRLRQLKAESSVSYRRGRDLSKIPHVTINADFDDAVATMEARDFVGYNPERELALA